VNTIQNHNDLKMGIEIDIIDKEVKTVKKKKKNNNAKKKFIPLQVQEVQDINQLVHKIEMS